MAQIRKYQPGGKTPNKIGVLTIDGKEYTGDGFIQHMREYGKTLDDKTRDPFGNIINALEAGENLSYDSDSDVLTGNVNWTGIRKSREDNLEQDRTKLGKFFGALNNGMEQNIRYSVNALRDMPAYEEPKEEVKGKSIDWSSQINLQYDVDKNGKRKSSKLGNSSAIARLNELTSLKTLGDNDTFKGFGGHTKEQYQDKYTSVDELIKAIEQGTLNEDQLRNLKDFGIFYDINTQSKTSKPGTNVTTTDAVKNELSSDELNKLFPGNWDFSRDFEQSKAWKPEYDYLKGKIKWGDVLYDASDLTNINSDLYKLYHNSGVYDLMKQGKIDEANKILNSFDKTYDAYYRYDPTKMYIPYFNAVGFPENMTHYKILGYDDNGNPKISYLSSNNETDQYGRSVPAQKYGNKNNGGGVYWTDESDKDFSSTGDLYGYDLLQNGEYNGYYAQPIQDEKGNVLITAYINPNSDNVFLDLGEYTPAEANGKNFIIPKYVFNEINRQDKWNKLFSKKYRKKFINGFRDLINTDWSRTWTQEMEKSDWNDIGALPQRVYDYFNKSHANYDAVTRKQQNLVSKPTQSHQMGGKIQFAQNGFKTPEPMKIDMQKAVANENMLTDKWTTADYLDIGSILWDLVGMGVGAATGGGNPASTGLGLLGTAFGFAADWTRDGLDGGDFANLGTGIAADASAFLPVIGGVGNAASIVKSVQRVGHLLNNAFTALGAVTAVKAVNDISNGRVTGDAIKDLSNGLLLLGANSSKFARVLKNSKYKGNKVNVSNLPNAAKLKQTYVDDIIKKAANEGADLKNGASWIKDGKIDYDAAYKALKDSKHITEGRIASKMRDWKGKRNERVNTILNNTVHGAYNPLSKNFIIRPENREWTGGNPDWRKNRPGLNYKAALKSQYQFGLENIPYGYWTNSWNEKIPLKYYSKDFIKALENSKTTQIPSNKHGGVIKADKGWKYDTNYNPYVGRSIYPTKAIDLAPDLEIPSLTTRVPSSTIETTSITFPQYQAYKGLKKPILVGKATEFKDFYDPRRIKLELLGNPTTTSTTSKIAGEAPPEWKQKFKDYASRAFNYENLNTLGQVIGAVAANHKVAKVTENALKSMPLSRNVFQASTPAYYENTRGFDVRRDALLNTQLPQTADAKLNAQWKRNIASELDKVNREKYDYLLQNRNQYNQFVNQIENKNRELRVAESNAFTDRLSQRDMALAENEAGTIANDFKTFEQALKKGLYNYQQDRAIYDQLALSDRKKMLLDKYSKKAAEWAKLNPAAENEKYMSDIERYFEHNSVVKSQYDNDVMQLNKSIYKPHSLWSPRFVKKGGKLSAQDHIKINKHKSQDRILENKYKAIDKAVQKLNDNVIKIFLNMMK